MSDAELERRMKEDVWEKEKTEKLVSLKQLFEGWWDTICLLIRAYEAFITRLRTRQLLCLKTESMSIIARNIRLLLITFAGIIMICKDNIFKFHCSKPECLRTKTKYREDDRSKCGKLDNRSTDNFWGE